VAGIDDHRSHFPCIRWRSITTPSVGYSWAASPIAGFALSVYVDHESIWVCQGQESVTLVVLDINHQPSRAQGVLPDTDRTEQAISYRNPGFVISPHPNSRKIEIEAL
jgi:hypothetical protein